MELPALEGISSAFASKLSLPFGVGISWRCQDRAGCSKASGSDAGSSGLPGAGMLPLQLAQMLSKALAPLAFRTENPTCAYHISPWIGRCHRARKYLKSRLT